MGWSCTKAAGDTHDKWAAICRKSTGSSNAFEISGARYFYECDNVEHDDGAITGEVFRMVSESGAKKIGNYRIGGDGSVKKWPAALESAMGGA